MLVTVTGQPDNNLTVWSFEKKEVSQVVTKNLETMNEARDVSFNPMDHNNIIVIGDQIFKNYKITNEQIVTIHSSLKARNKNLSNNFKCYAWIIDKENKEI